MENIQIQRLLLDENEDEVDELWVEACCRHSSLYGRHLRYNQKKMWILCFEHKTNTRVLCGLNIDFW